MPACFRMGTKASDATSMPAYTRSTFASMNWLAQLIEPSGVPSAAQWTSLIWAPATPPARLMASTATSPPIRYSGAPMAPLSSLTYPIVIVCPACEAAAAVVADPGTVLATTAVAAAEAAAVVSAPAVEAERPPAWLSPPQAATVSSTAASAAVAPARVVTPVMCSSPLATLPVRTPIESNHSHSCGRCQEASVRGAPGGAAVVDFSLSGTVPEEQA